MMKFVCFYQDFYYTGSTVAFSFKKMHFNMLSGKYWPFWFGIRVLIVLRAGNNTNQNSKFWIINKPGIVVEEFKYM